MLDQGDGSMDGWMKPGRLGWGKGQRGREADTRTTREWAEAAGCVGGMVTHVLSTDLEIAGPLGAWTGECWSSHLLEVACGWAPARGEGK